jgi:DNA-directed RNA polymerase subunit RPC12/RpoP
MAGPLNAKVIMAKCTKTKKSYGIRIEQRGSDWVRTWAFPIDEDKAKREGFDTTVVTGSFEPVDGYTGCPYCKSTIFTTCYCGKIGCSSGPGEYTCPWCGKSFVSISSSSVDVSGGGY